MPLLDPLLDLAVGGGRAHKWCLSSFSRGFLTFDLASQNNHCGPGIIRFLLSSARAAAQVNSRPIREFHTLPSAISNSGIAHQTVARSAEIDAGTSHEGFATLYPSAMQRDFPAGSPGGDRFSVCTLPGNLHSTRHGIAFFPASSATTLHIHNRLRQEHYTLS